MRILLFFSLLTTGLWAQNEITPIQNPIPGDRIQKAIVYRDTLFLASGKELWAYDGNTFSLKKTFNVDIGAMTLKGFDLYVFGPTYKYNGTWRKLHAQYYYQWGPLDVRDVVVHQDTFYLAGYDLNYFYNPVRVYSWCGDSCMMDLVSFSSDRYCFPPATSISIYNNQVVVSGVMEGYCLPVIETLTGPKSTFNGGLRSGYGYHRSFMMHEVFNGYLYACGIFDTSLTSGQAFNNTAVWDGTSWSPFNAAIFDSADYCLSLSICDHLVFAFPGFHKKGTGTTIRVVYEDASGWHTLNDAFYAPRHFDFSFFGSHLADTIYHLRTITYQGNVYMYGDALDMNDNRTFNKLGRLAAYIGEQEKHLSHTSITVYPNPAQDLLQVEGPEQLFEYVIYGINGLKMLEGKALDEINIATLPDGLYILEVHLVNAVQRQRFVKRN